MVDSRLKTAVDFFLDWNLWMIENDSNMQLE